MIYALLIIIMMSLGSLFCQARQKLAKFSYQSEPNHDATESGEDVHRTNRRNCQGVCTKVKYNKQYTKSAILSNF